MKRQKWGSIALLVSTLFSIGINNAFALETTVSFTDVKQSHPNYNAISELKKRGVIAGYDDGTFRPDQPVKRVEAVKMLLLGAGINDIKTTTVAKFSDTDSNGWYAGYLNKAVELKIVSGNSDGTFSPEKTVNLVENLKMLLLAQKVEVPPTPTSDPSADTPKGSWFAPYVQYAKDKKLIELDSLNKVYPDQAMTRGKLAELMYRVIYMKERGQTVYTPMDTVTPDQNQLVLDMDIKNNEFAYPDITIGDGTTIKWTNKDSVDHTVTSDTGITLDSELLSTGDSFSFTFNELGVYEYHCSVHPDMKGKITVKPKEQVPTI